MSNISLDFKYWKSILGRKLKKDEVKRIEIDK